MRKVLSATWYNQFALSGAIIGIVKVEDYGEIKYYIGLGEGQDEKWDIDLVLRNGARFYTEAFKEAKTIENEIKLRTLQELIFRDAFNRKEKVIAIDSSTFEEIKGKEVKLKIPSKVLKEIEEELTK